MISWYPGILVSWYHDILVSWYSWHPGILVSWYSDIWYLVSWYPCILISWYHDFMIPWYPGIPNILVSWYLVCSPGMNLYKLWVDTSDWRNLVWLNVKGVVDRLVGTIRYILILNSPGHHVVIHPPLSSCNIYSLSIQLFAYSPRCHSPIKQRKIYEYRVFVCFDERVKLLCTGPVSTIFWRGCGGIRRGDVWNRSCL